MLPCAALWAATRARSIDCAAAGVGTAIQLGGAHAVCLNRAGSVRWIRVDWASALREMESFPVYVRACDPSCCRDVCGRAVLKPGMCECTGPLLT